MKFAIATLGCKVNTYESNVISDLLKNKGYKEVKFNDYANIYIINTCTVTNTADNKSIKIIKQTIKRNKDALIFVMGCLTQVNKDKVNNIDGVDIIIGNKNKTKIVEYIEEYINNKQKIVKVIEVDNQKFEDMKLINFANTRAFVKIQDGCNNYCSYCIIPYTRGNVCSKQPSRVIEEVKSLINNGHKEIVLTGIHTGSYGVDLNDYNLASLLNNLIKIKGLERVRISSIEITEINNELLNIIGNNKILVDHMHIPLQSGSNKILKLMNRKYDINYFLKKIDDIRRIRPDISITTDVIVGFPGEFDNDFNETIETIKKVRFSKIHVFPYSVRTGTKAANMDNQISNEIKKERVHKLLELSKQLELEYMNKFIDKELIFIPEKIKDGYLIGHTGNYLLVKMKSNLKTQESVKCRVKSVNYPYTIVEDLV